MQISHSIVHPGAEHFPGRGNIDADPLLDEEFRPLPNSPAIDAGTITHLTMDLAGNPRPVDIPGIGIEGPGAFDIGAYEFQLEDWPTPTPTEEPAPTPTPGPMISDIDGDDLVNWVDLFLLQQDWLKEMPRDASEERVHKTDLNDDEWVDAEDLMLLLSGWRASRLQEEEPVRLFYYYGSSEIDLTASESMIGVGFRASVSASDRMKFMEDHSSISSFVDAATVNQKVHRLTLENPLALNRLLDFLDSLAEDSRVEYVTPVFPFQFSDILLDNALNVKFNPEVTDEEIEGLILPNGISILQSGRPAHRHGIFLMAPSEGTLSKYHWRNAVTALFVANLYHETLLTEFAAPNLIFTNIFSKS